MCYFLYITLYNTPDNIKPFGYCIHHGPKIFGGAGPLPLLIRNTIKQEVIIMMFQIKMCFLVCTNIPGAGCICLNIMTEQLGFGSYKSKPHLSAYLTGSSDFFCRHKRIKCVVLKQEDNINKKPYLSVSHRVSTHICTSSKKLNLLNCLQLRLKTMYLEKGGVLLI